MEQNNKNGNLALPEFANIGQILTTLKDRAITSGQPGMGTFTISDQLLGILVVGDVGAIAALSRIIRTIGSSSLVKMGGGQ